MSQEQKNHKPGSLALTAKAIPDAKSPDPEMVKHIFLLQEMEKLEMIRYLQLYDAFDEADAKPAEGKGGK